MVEFQARGVAAQDGEGVGGATADLLFVLQTLCRWPGLLEGGRDRYTKRLFTVYLKFKFSWASVLYLAASPSPPLPPGITV